jgi:hypothetical protein
MIFKNPFAISPFERAWATAPPGHRLILARQEEYDPWTGLFHAPAHYIPEPAAPARLDLPGREWVYNEFCSFVRGEFSISEKGNAPQLSSQIPGFDSDNNLIRHLLEQYETDLVYGGLTEGLIRAAGDDMGDQIYALLTNASLGDKRNVNCIDKTSFKARIHELNAKKVRLQFILPAFPFKDQNPFRTQVPASSPDLGEVALLARLHSLVLAIYQCHPFGADWIILTDGVAYHKALRVPTGAVTKYHRRLLQYRDALNCYRTISFIDLEELARKLVVDLNGEPLFEPTVTEIGSILQSGFSNEEVSIQMQVLTRGMKWNMNYQDVFRDAEISPTDQWTVITKPEPPLDPKLGTIWKGMHDDATKAAVYYASFNLALRFHEVSKRFSPNAIRATVHAKPGQIVAPSLGRVAPWNGIPVLQKDKNGRISIECIELYKAAQRGPIEKVSIDSVDAWYYQLPEVVANSEQFR